MNPRRLLLAFLLLGVVSITHTIHLTLLSTRIDQLERSE